MYRTRQYNNAMWHSMPHLNINQMRFTSTLETHENDWEAQTRHPLIINWWQLITADENNYKTTNYNPKLHSFSQQDAFFKYPSHTFVAISKNCPFSTTTHTFLSITTNNPHDHILSCLSGVFFLLLLLLERKVLSKQASKIQQLPTSAAWPHQENTVQSGEQLYPPSHAAAAAPAVNIARFLQNSYYHIKKKKKLNTNT